MRTKRTGAQWQLDIVRRRCASAARAPSGWRRSPAATSRTSRPAGRCTPGRSPRSSRPAAGRSHFERVEQFMTTDLYHRRPGRGGRAGRQPDDSGRRIRHVPVEDAEHRLIGIISQRTLIASARRAGRRARARGRSPVREVMSTEPRHGEPRDADARGDRADARASASAACRWSRTAAWSASSPSPTS